MKSDTIIYLIPGQGSDYRLFSNLQLDDRFEIRCIEHVVPVKGTTLPEYARMLALQIDVSRPFVLIGVSLGGMVAIEINSFLDPVKTFLISSAKTRKELPPRYRFQKYVPVYKLVSPGMAKSGAKFLQPILEPDRNNHKDIFLDMLDDKDPLFLHHTIDMIINWDREESDDQAIHIHGDNDHTIPVKNIKYDYLIKDGSHMMVMTHADEISRLINHFLAEVD
ncbi:MAG: alpha/beta fold hydrolase [Bacteroidales bacterium]